MKRKTLMIVSALMVVFALVLVTVIVQNNFKNTAETASELESGIEHDSEVLHKETAQKMKDKDLLSSKQNDSDVEAEDEEKVDESEKVDEKPKEEKVIEYATKFVNVSSLNVRTGPGTDHDVIGVVAVNQEVDAGTEKDENGWVEVLTDDFSGYVNGSYLSDEKVEIKVAEVKESKKEESSKSTDSSSKKDHPKTEEKTEEKKKETNTNGADKLKTVDANNQLILVTSNGYGTSKAKVQTFERNSSGTWDKVLDAPGFIGKNGFASTKKEGDMKSPRGKYTIGTAFGRNGNPGTKLSFRNITSDDVWVDDSNSSLYNTWQSRKETKGQWSSAEDMDIPLYTYGFVINYNTNQVPKAGSAIFFHIANSYTAGCTGLSEANVISILKWLDPAKKPVIIQAPVSELGNY